MPGFAKFVAMKISDKDRNIKRWRSPWTWILFAILILIGVYAVISYWVPYFQLRSVTDASYSECAEGDQACVERNMALWQKSWEVMTPTLRVVKSQEFAEALKHPDGTACF